MKMLLGLAAAGVAMLASPASGATMTVGARNALAHACYRAAETRLSTLDAIDVCNRSLNEEALDRHDRLATLVNRGIVRHFRHEYAAAVASYDDALALVADQPDALVNKALATLVAGGDARAAVVMLDRALTGTPEKPWVGYYLRGAAHELAGDIPAAYGDYKRASALKPDWAVPAQALSRFTVVRRAG